MNIEQRIRRKEPEDLRLEYKSHLAESRKVAKEVAAMANSEGGVVVLGVRDDDDGRPAELENIESTDKIRLAVSDVINERVEPYPDFESEIIEIDGKTLTALTVSRSDKLHSYYHERIEEPVFLVRRQTEVRYLSGHEVNDYFEERFSSQDSESDENRLLRLPDEKLDQSQFDEYFIESPDGHISEICLFSDVHHPGNPTRISLGTDYVPEERAEHILACLDILLDASTGDSYFTINQSNGAWVGQGYYNFVRNLRERESRYENIRERGYDLKLYGNEQAVLVTDLDPTYPESTLIVYVAPFADQEGYRHITLNLLIDGTPTDVRPLIEFSERTGLNLNPSKEVELTVDGISNPARIPVEVRERTARASPLGEERLSIDGAICANPFFGREDVLRQELEVDSPTPLAKYSRLYGFLFDWDNPEDPHEYDSERLVVYDWKDYTRGIYANVKEVKFNINW